MWTHEDTMWTDADCLQKCGQMQTINADSTETRSMLRAMVRYGTPLISRASAIFWDDYVGRAFHVNDRARMIFWALRTTADKWCGQMRTVWNNAEKCRQTAEKCGQTADMREWKCFDIERLCLVTYPYLRMIFTLFFSRVKVRTVHGTQKVMDWVLLPFWARHVKNQNFSVKKIVRCLMCSCELVHNTV